MKKYTAASATSSSMRTFADLAYANRTMAFATAEICVT